MICEPCKDGYHTVCDNDVTEEGTFRVEGDVRDSCFCQHILTEKLADGTVAPIGVRRDVR
jgi:hypothetical protein